MDASSEPSSQQLSVEEDTGPTVTTFDIGSEEERTHDHPDNAHNGRSR